MGRSRGLECEHAALRNLLTALGDAIYRHDPARCTGISETRVLIMSPHDHEEDEILYPMADQVLKCQQSLASHPVSTDPRAA